MRTHILASTLTLLLACGGGEQPPTTSTVRDSAGITIVESHAPAWGPGDAWRLSEEPIVSIGVAEGAEEYQLFRANFGVRLSNGEIVVANTGTHELRFYDADGIFVHSSGREGGGPGEFKNMGRLWRLTGDSLLVYDSGNARYTVHGPRGEYVRTLQLDPTGAMRPYVDGAFADGTLLAHASVGTPYGAGLPPGLSRDSAIYLRYAPDGALLDSQALRPGIDRYAGELGGSPMMTSPPPLGRWARVAVSRGSWYYGSSDDFSIEQYSVDGALGRIIRRIGGSREVTAEIASAIRNRMLESPARMPDAVRRWMAEIPLPRTMPAHKEIVASDDGYLWVAEYRLLDETPAWDVFDGDGRFLGVVETPSSGRIWQIGSDFVLGGWNDEMDVEQARVYRLIKP